MKKIIITILALLAIISLSYILIPGIRIFINPPQEISKVEFESLLKKWNEPKVVMWYYIGSDKTFNYFQYQDLGIERNYKIKISEETIYCNSFVYSPFNTKNWKGGSPVSNTFKENCIISYKKY